MAGCGQCPDECNCNIVDQNGNQYAGSGTPGDPIVIPRADNAPWEGTSSDGSITITPGDSTTAGDGHAPDLVVDWCQALDCDVRRDSGRILLCPTEDDVTNGFCKPKSLRDSVDGEFLGSDGAGGWTPTTGALSAAAFQTGFMIPFAGPEASVPAGYLLAAGQLVLQASYPTLFALINHDYNGGVDPGGGQFRLPDARGRGIIGPDAMGGSAASRVTGAVLGASGGVQDVTLGATQIPSHSHTATDSGHTHTSPAHGHTISDPGHSHPLSAAGVAVFVVGHNHQPGTAGEFVTVNTANHIVAILPDPGNAVRVFVNDSDDDQKTNANTSTDGGHSHTLGGATDGAATGVTNLTTAVTINSGTASISVGSTGGGLAHTNMPPWLSVNWIIKT